MLSKNKINTLLSIYIIKFNIDRICLQQLLMCHNSTYTNRCISSPVRIILRLFGREAEAIDTVHLCILIRTEYRKPKQLAIHLSALLTKISLQRLNVITPVTKITSSNISMVRFNYLISGSGCIR